MQIGTIVLFSLATLCFLGRICIRLFTRRRLYLDDFLMLFAFACLCGSSGIMFTRIKMIYLEFAILSGIKSSYSLAFENLNDLVSENAWSFAWLILTWTAIFSVKWCYLAFFYPLIRNMSVWFVWYYRIGVALSVAFWVVIIVAEQLISCPYFGKKAGGRFKRSLLSLKDHFQILECLKPTHAMSH